ncbi:MAG: TDT family transporter [Eubacterium sp.]|jgi:exfoliative toxin A/B|nr:TDT family transporter [Eubacterium sp.]
MPIPLSGVMLGFAALGNYLKSSSVMLWGLMECIALFLLVLLILKILMFPRETAADMGNAAIAGASGTFSMGLMFLGVGAAFVNRYAGAALWGIGLLLHILLILYFTGTFVLHFRLEQVYTTWFLVYVGITAAAATGSVFGMQRLGRVLVYWGLACTAALMVLITVRYVRIPVEKHYRPMTAIYAAPVSLCLVGYIQSFDGTKERAVLILAFLAHVFYVFGLILAVRLIGKRFYPSFSAFTFPFINTAAATRLSASAAGQAGIGGKLLQLLVKPECAIGMALLLIVFCRYLPAVFAAKDVENPSTKRKKFIYGGKHNDRTHSQPQKSDRI